MFDKPKSNKPGGAVTEDFSRPQESDSGGSFASSSAPRASALIGATIKIKGDVSGDENLIIEGKVDGTVNLGSKHVTVGQSGRVNANITATVIKVEGEVKGDMSGSEKVVISKSGKVQGNIVAPRVTLEDGAKFKGSIDMDPGGQAEVTPITASTKAQEAAGSQGKGGADAAKNG